MKQCVRFLSLVIAALGMVSFTGCTSNGIEAKPEVHGKMGVQVESQDTRRIRPVQ